MKIIKCKCIELLKDRDQQNILLKNYPTISYLLEIHFRAKDTAQLKRKGWKKIFHANSDCIFLFCITLKYPRVPYLRNGVISASDLEVTVRD